MEIDGGSSPKVQKNTIVGKEWFAEECKKVNEERTACRPNAIHRPTRKANNKYR
jgi:hypothetical protein